MPAVLPDSSSLPLHLERLRPLAWPGFSFLLPPGWEMTGYSLKADPCRMQFHHQVRECGELSWREVVGTPDLPRMLRGTLERIHQVDGASQVRSFTIGEWQLAHLQSGRTLAMLWQSARRRVLQWSFAQDGDRLRGSEFEALLRSFDGNGGPTQRWQLFGLHCTLAPDVVFERVIALPALATLMFHTTAGLRLTVRRFGMVEELLGMAGGEQAFYRQLINREGNRVLAVADDAALGRPAVRLDFERRGMKGMDVLMGAWWKGQGWLWRDQAEGRLYSLEQVGPDQAPRLELADVLR